MSNGQPSRRRVIKQAGELSAFGVFANSDPNTTRAAEDMKHLILGEELIDDGFTQVQESNSLSDTLIEADSTFESATSACTGYIKGEDLDNPNWVIGSAAIHTPSPYDLETVREIITMAFNEFLREFNDETPAAIEFEQETEHSSDHSDWSYQMTRTVEIGDQGPFKLDVFTERQRCQFFEQTLLATLVFGPTGLIQSPVDEMVDEYARLQREWYHEAVQ